MGQEINRLEVEGACEKDSIFGMGNTFVSFGEERLCGDYKVNVTEYCTD